MRIVVQRVKEAHVSVEGNIIPYFAEKIPHLRIFSDDNDKMSRSLLEVKGSLLVISQFTLYGDCKTGRRPSFTNSAPPEKAEALYQELVDALEKRVSQVETGIFGASMQVALTNDGPITLILES
jgi:D-tyrosyl-tRNA(Tyr) deacylase